MRAIEDEPIIEHITPPGGNVFLDIGFDADEAANLLVRSQLMSEITSLISERRLKQKDAAKLFGVSQPRISDLKRGKVDAFTIDSLVNMLGNARMRVNVTVATLPPQYHVSAAESGEPEAPAAARA